MTTSLVTPFALCRLDGRLLARIQNGERLGGIAWSSLLAIAIGTGAYGFAFGLWRGLAQALFSAVKLPALIILVAAGTLLLSGMLASVLRARLTVRQTAVCILLSMAVLSVVLGALAPIAIMLAEIAPPPDPAALGLPIDDARVATSLSVARAQLLVHVAVIAGAGIIGVARLRGLLARLGLSSPALRRVMVSFIAMQLAVGAQLAWLMRPFFGRPHLPPTFSCDDLTKGNFFEEVVTSMRPFFGNATFAVLGVFACLVVVALAAHLRDADVVRRYELGPAGLALDDGRSFPFGAILFTRAHGATVEIGLTADETLASERLRLAAGSTEAATALAAALEAERRRVRAGPFRTLAPRC